MSCRQLLQVFMGCGLALLAAAGLRADDAPGQAKTPSKLFATIQVDILDDREGWFTTAELYLKVLSTRDAKASLLLPLNVGGYAGNRRIFETPLPLVPGAGETLLFELLDEDGLTATAEKALLAAADAGDFLIWAGPKVFRAGGWVPGRPLRTLGELILEDLAQHQFDHYGQADYNVPDDPPSEYRSANDTVILDGNHARAKVRVFYQER